MIEETTVVEDAVQVDTTEIAEIMSQARGRRTLRGLRKPKNLPASGWYSKQPRPLKDGSTGEYLYYRWRDPDSNKGRSMSLGRLN